MQIRIFATDYDSSLAYKGRVSEAALAALYALKESGRKVMLVTGRRMDDLLNVFAEIDVCDAVVAENGAVLYWPATQEMKLLAERPSTAFIDELRKASVHPLVPGEIILATLTSQAQKVNEVIARMKVPFHGILNKESLMVLPKPVDKSYGMLLALKAQNLAPENCVAVGDAENDICMLQDAGCGVAVANAIQSVKDIADIVTESDHGFGILEIVDQILKTDLQGVERRSRSRRT